MYAQSTHAQYKCIFLDATLAEALRLEALRSRSEIWCLRSTEAIWEDLTSVPQ